MSTENSPMSMYELQPNILTNSFIYRAKATKSVNFLIKCLTAKIEPPIDKNVHLFSSACARSVRLFYACKLIS